MTRKLVIFLTLSIPICCFLSVILYTLPPVNERLAWRIDELRAKFKYALNPPEEQVFQPGVQQTEQQQAEQLFRATLTALPTFTPMPTQPGPTATPTPVPTLTPVPTPLPIQVMLSGFTHMYQMWNNCGPANLAMALSYWGWKGDQRDTAAYTKPNQRDKNVMPYEMVSFVQDETELRALSRVGIDLQILKSFVAAGFPVIVEKGFEGVRFDSWMGHYEVVNGYDDLKQAFYVQDSYDGPNLKVSYEDMLKQWRAFNNTYIVIYPPDREAEVLSILGPQADLNYNYQAALQKSVDESSSLTGRDQFFAWYNRGTDLVGLHDYQGAAVAYDAAFANYPSIPEKERPWRILWYQTGPYFAYYFTERYQDVIDLATTTLDAMSEPVLEESFYWRGRAKLALGDTDGALADFRKSIAAHPGFQPALEQLQLLGAEP